MEQAPNALTKGSVVKALVTFTLPFLLANVLQSLYGAVDLFVVGQYCDAQSVAAVSTGTQVTQIVTSLVTGLTLGGTILIGKYTGMERWDKVKTAIGTTLSIFALVALALTALMLLFEAPLLTLLNTPAESFEATMEYVAICAWGNFSSAATIRSAPCSGATGTQSVPCILWGWPVWSISCWIFFSSSTWAWGQGGPRWRRCFPRGSAWPLGLGI